MSEHVTHLADQVMTALNGYMARSNAQLEAKFADRLAAMELALSDLSHKPAPVETEKTAVVIEGKDGRDGIDGKDGAPGKDGEKGLDGVNGKDGEAGGKGADGKDGRDGVDGKDGAPGKDGKDGIDGNPGKDGANGKDGIDGINGKDGSNGVDGKDGSPGLRGEHGLKGDAGQDGRDGEPGRDAVHIEVLEAVDPKRKYQRGTFANFNGGLIRSFRATDPFDGDLARCGWHVVVNGVASVSFALDGERTLIVESSMTSGELMKSAVTLPIMVHRNVWKDDAFYARGDTVTWNGSMWHCNSATQARPGTSEDWTLAVKHGRDGKDGSKGDKGEPGITGKAGRDLTQIGPDGSKW